MTGSVSLPGSSEDWEPTPFGPVGERASAGRSFLIVDEARTIRVIATEILAKLGYSTAAVSAVDRPSAGLAAFRGERPSVVFMELDHLLEDGLPIALEMLEEDPHVKLVVLTAEGASSERVRRVVRAGAFAVVEKPLRHEKLRAVLADLEMEEGGIERLG